MTDHAAHVADAASADNAAPAQTRGFAPAAANGQDTAPPVPGRGRHAAETRRLYAADWAAFAAWCRAAGLAIYLVPLCQPHHSVADRLRPPPSALRSPADLRPWLIRKLVATTSPSDAKDADTGPVLSPP